MLEETKGLIKDCHLLIFFPHIEFKDDSFVYLYILF